ncbi:type II toxin-antitoxin system VapC family toxin [Cellulomonas shaoxiangyii]|uniref:type II toxin-antitoxin system VapC family toxin n=1 Tax=Cellulomonas shaoxiangyii TaxID=2566013 RepID=UPI001FB5FC04|nr:type II toxin-antitoxin system VapC family toxin [Cellulomonas shaoxiangyii]
MRYLLDTHVLLWLLGDAERVPEPVRADLADPGVTLLVSAASALEVATKQRLGRLDVGDLVDVWARRVAEIGGTELPVGADHALLAGRLGWDHRDPFDRLLVAQAVVENATLVTVDARVRAYGRAAVLTW